MQSYGNEEGKHQRENQSLQPDYPGQVRVDGIDTPAILKTPPLQKTKTNLPRTATPRDTNDYTITQNRRKYLFISADNGGARAACRPLHRGVAWQI